VYKTQDVFDKWENLLYNINKFVRLNTLLRFYSYSLGWSPSC